MGLSGGISGEKMLNFADFGLDINILLFIGAGLVIGVCGYFLTAVTGLFYI